MNPGVSRVVFKKHSMRLVAILGWALSHVDQAAEFIEIVPIMVELFLAWFLGYG